MLAGLIIGVLLAGAGLAVTGHIDQDRYGWRWPAGIGAGALLAAILLVLAATLHEPRHAPKPAATATEPVRPAAERDAVRAGGSARQAGDAAGPSRYAGGAHRSRTGAPPGAAGSHAARPDGGATAAPAGASPTTTGDAASTGTGGVSALGTEGVSALGTEGVSALGTEGVSALGTGGVSALGTGGVSALGTGGAFTAGTGGAFTAGTGGAFTAGTGGASPTSIGGAGATGTGRGSTGAAAAPASAGGGPAGADRVGSEVAGSGATFRRLAAVEPEEIDADWLTRSPAGPADGRGDGAVRDGTFFGGTVPAESMPVRAAGDSVSAESMPVRAAGDSVSAESMPVRAAGDSVSAESMPVRAAGDSVSAESMPVRAAGDSVSAESMPVRAAGDSVSAESMPVRAAGDSVSAEPAPGPATGDSGRTLAEAGGVSATDAGTAAGAGTSHPAAAGASSPAGAAALSVGDGAPDPADETGRPVERSRESGAAAGSGAGVDRYGTPLAASGAAVGGRTADSATAAGRHDAVPGPRDGASRPAPAVPVPAWAAADSGQPEPDGRPGTVRPGPAAAEEATVPGLLPDEAERIAAVRAKLAGVLPPGTVGWQVPGGTPGQPGRPAAGAAGPDSPRDPDRVASEPRDRVASEPRDRVASEPRDRVAGQFAGRPAPGLDGSSSSSGEHDAAVLRLTDLRHAPDDWDPHLDIDPERTTDLRRGEGTPVRGYVRAGATPVPHAAVTVIDLAGRQAGRDVSGTDGWYQLAVPRSGTYTLIARARGHQPLASVVAVDGAPVQLDLTLVGSAAIAGTVRLSGGASAVPAAVVSLMDASGAVLGAVTAGADGSFRFAELIGGGYTVVGNAPGYRPAAVPVTVPSTGTATVEVALTGDAVLVGIARGGRDHRPLADAQVTLLGEDGEVAGRCMTGPDGGYRFAGMPPGKYTLVASGYPTVSNALHLTAGARHDHDIMLGYQPDGTTG
ncbi:hypothetical protein Athai_45010 [Actinocatenispora thailandica]|uniref:Uncharacterized protein n=1 Tax=Actinocatenispora thailandica TaxID=227318 RepID=A0A7R7HZD3_9ACTN|nr:hypothetical protein Athai_45010 [Actinocatenispora thailandica]